MIERLTRGEGARLRAVRLQALADAPEAFATTLAEAQAWDAQRWDAQVEALPTFVWCEAGVDLGMVRGAPHDHDPEAGYLISLWVARSARGRGVGLALIAAVIAWARAHGLRRLLLDVGAANRPAQALYERAGFVVPGGAGSLPAQRESACEVQMLIDLGDG